MPNVSERWIVGLPEIGGICVFDLDEMEYPVGMLGLWNAFTMDERCRVIERLGEKFYSKLEAAPQLNWMTTQIVESIVAST